MKRQIGFRKDDSERKDENIGEPVKILVSGGVINFVGYLEKCVNGTAILRPSLIYEPIVDSAGKEIPRYRVEKERPLEINSIGAIVPISQDFYNSLVRLNKEQTFS